MVYQEALGTLDTEKMLRLFFKTNFASFEQVFVSAKFWSGTQNLKSCFFSIPFLINDSKHVILFFAKGKQLLNLKMTFFYFKFSLIFAKKNNRSLTIKKMAFGKEFPFGPFIAISGFIVWLCGSDFYFGRYL